MVSYDAYKNRIEKIAAVKNFIVKFRALFIILTLLLLGGITTLLAIKGMVTGNLTVPAEVVYGDSYEVEGGSAVMSSVKYEFSPADGGDWSREKPTKAGKYLARIATTKSFGGAGHGAAVPFEIKPRPTEFVIHSKSVVYGSDPANYAIQLVNGDRLADGLSFEYENIDGFDASVCVNRASLQILSPTRENVTNCYEISAPSAQITLSAKKITVPVKELNFTYSGETVLYESEIEKFLQELLVGDDTPTFDVELVQKTRALAPEEAPLRAGTYTVRVTPRQVFKGETDVTHLYETEPFLVTIVVLPRSVTIKTGSAQQIYNAQPLVCRDYTAEELISGDYLVASGGEASIVNAGSIENRYTYSIFTRDGEDVSDCYAIDYRYGTLTVNKRPVTVSSESESWVYDGLAHSVTENYGLGGLLSGHRAELTDFARITSVGTTTNVLYFELYDDADGNPVTENYQINGTWGTLEITKRPITITTVSDEKIYDGEALLNDKTQSVVGLADGEKERTFNTFSITDAGEAENRTVYRIYADYSDTTENYDITYVYGTLKITKRAVTVITGTKAEVYDGTPFSYTEYGQAPNLVSTHTLLADSSKPIASVTNVAEGEVENKVSYFVLDGFGNDVSANYLLTYEYGKISRTLRPLLITTATSSKEYDGVPYRDTEGWEAPNLAWGQTLCTAESNPTSSVTEVSEGAIDNIVSYFVVDGAGNDVSANYAVEYIYGKISRTPFEITLTTATESTVYDGETHSNTNYTVNRFTNVGHQIVVDESFAPASVTYYTDGVKENEVHYIVLDHAGRNVSYNYNITYLYGEISILARGLTITTGSAEKVYDGGELSQPVPKSVTGLADGERAEADSVFAITEAVTADNETTYKIYAGGFETTANYDILYIPGTLKITPRPIKITTATDSWEYDGEPHSNSYAEADDLVGEHTLTAITSPVSVTNVKESGAVNRYEYDVFDGARRVTDNYAITYKYGTLTVTPRTILVTTSSYTFVYNGEDLFDKSFSFEKITADGEIEDIDPQDVLVLDHGYSVEFYATIRNVGSKDNEITIHFYSSSTGSLTDVTENYKISYKYGTLTVTQREINVTTASDEWEYDGVPHSNQTAAAENIVPGHVVKPTGTPVTITDAGTADNEYTTFRIYDEGEEEVTKNYSILSVTYGTLKITQRNIVINTATDSWEYDGANHSNPSASAARLVSGHQLQATSYTEIVNAGETDNVCEFIVLDGAGVDITKNYSLSYLYGTLTVTPRAVLVSTDNATKFYDGKPLYFTEYEAMHVASNGGEPAFVLSHTLELLTHAEITEAGSIENVCTYQVIDPENPESDISGNYSVSYKYGKLTVNKMPIFIRTIDYTWEYDGETHSGKVEDILYGNGFSNIYNYNFQGIAEGERIEFTNFATITNVGGTPNKVTYKVYAEADGRETTHNYVFSVLAWGTLTVTQRPLTIKTGSAKKEYDGTKLTCNTPESVEGEIVDGQELVVDHECSRVDAGREQNTTTYQIYSGTTITTGNYKISYVFSGELEVTPRFITVTTDSKEFEYDGKPQSYPVAKEIYHHKSKGEESGLVLGHELRATEFVSVTNVKEGEVENKVTFIVVDENGDSMVNNGNYIISDYIYGTLKITPRALTITTGSAEKEYDGTPFTYTEGATADRLVDLHTLSPDESRKDEFASVTNVYEGIVENKVYYRVFDEYGEDVTDNYAITYNNGEIYITPYGLTVTTASDSKFYDGTPLQKLDGFTWDWLFGDHELVLDYSRENDFASITNVFDGDEVLEDENGTKYGTKPNQLYFKVISGTDERAGENYVVADEENGTLKILAKRVIIKTASLEKEYDGTPLYGNGEEPQMPYPSYSILEGHTLEADFIENITDVVWSVGGYLNGVVLDKLNETTYKVLSEDGDDISQNYDIHYSNGKLKITPRVINVETQSASHEYTGYKWGAYSNPIMYHVASEGGGSALVAGHIIDLNGIAAQSKATTVCNVGTAENVVEFLILDPNDSAHDVNGNYEFVYVKNGTLEVTPRKIEVTTGSAAFEYNDEEFSYTEDITADRPLTETVGVDLYRLVADGSKDIATIIDVVWTEDGKVGSIPNVFSCIVLDPEGEDVSYNYEITYQYGTLTVEPRDITVTTADHEWTYDGSEHSALGCEAERLVSGHELVAVSFAKILNAGTLENVVEYEVYKGTVNVTKNYNIAYVYGTLEITPREITVTLTPTESVTYGDPIAEYASGAGNYAGVSGKGLVAGEQLELAVYYTDEDGNRIETPKNAGTYYVVIDIENSLIHKNDEQTDTSNYSITQEESGFEIEKRMVVARLNAETDGKEYDGKPYIFPNTSYTLMGTSMAYSETLFIGVEYHDADEQIVSAPVDAGVYYIHLDPDSCTIDGVQPASVNYNVLFYPVLTYTITPREITVTLDDITREYNGKQFDYQGEGNTVHVEGLVKGTLKATVNCEGFYVGTYDVTFDRENWSVEGDLTSNYTLGSVTDSTVEITKRNITVGIDSLQLEYRGEVIPDSDIPYSSRHATENLIGFVADDDKEVTPVYTYTQNGSAAVPKERGVYTVAISFAGNPLIDDNYDITYEEGTLEIIMRFVTVEVDATPDFEYDGEAFDMTSLSYSHYHTGNREEAGFLDGDEAHYNVTFTVSGYTEGNIIYAGTYTVTVQLTPKGVDDGYVISYVDTSFTVEKRQIYAVPDRYSMEYCKQTPDLKAELAAPDYYRPDGSQTFVNDDYAYVSVSYRTVNAAGATVNAVNAGTYKIYVSSLGSGFIAENYELVYEQSDFGVLEITPRRLIVAPRENQSVLYTGAPLALDPGNYKLLGGTSLAGVDKLTVEGDAFLDGKEFYTIVHIKSYSIMDGSMDMRKNYSVICSYEGNEDELAALGIRESAFYVSLSYERRKVKILQIPPEEYKNLVYSGDIVDIKYEGDGSQLFYEYKTLAESGLAESEEVYGLLAGHSIKVVSAYVSGSAGTYKKWLQLAVEDEAGNDCSLGYTIVFDENPDSFITVSKISVSVTVTAAVDYEKDYTLGGSDYGITDGALLEGHYLEIKAEGGKLVWKVYESLGSGDTVWQREVTRNYNVIITEV